MILHGYQMQNGWMQYGLDKMIEQDLTWQSLIHRYSEQLTKFVLNGLLKTLPSPDNLRRWNQAKGILCGLCGKPDVTLKHILAGCSWVFSVENKKPHEDRYLWRHNCCLRVVAVAIMSRLRDVNASPQKRAPKARTRQAFVKAGSAPKRRAPRPRKCILDPARDWKCNFDLREVRLGEETELVFPHDVCPTARRIDGYTISREEKICVLGPEMTSPMDDNVDKWHKQKRTNTGIWSAL